METLLAEGRVRAIGVSNFMPEHLDALLQQATIIPAVNQVEMHPYFTEPGRADGRHRARESHPAWSPIGGRTSYRGSGTSTFDDMLWKSALSLAASDPRNAANTARVTPTPAITVSRNGRYHRQAIGSRPRPGIPARAAEALPFS